MPSPTILCGNNVNITMLLNFTQHMYLSKRSSLTSDIVRDYRHLRSCRIHILNCHAQLTDSSNVAYMTSEIKSYSFKRSVLDRDKNCVLEVLRAVRSFDVQQTQKQLCDKRSSVNMATGRNRFLNERTVCCSTSPFEVSVSESSKCMRRYSPVLCLYLHLGLGLSGSLHWVPPTKILNEFLTPCIRVTCSHYSVLLDVTNLITFDAMCTLCSLSLRCSLHSVSTAAHVCGLAPAPCFQKHPVWRFRSSGLLHHVDC